MMIIPEKLLSVGGRGRVPFPSSRPFGARAAGKLLLVLVDAPHPTLLKRRPIAGVGT
jgi:hypothetical protein